MASLKQRLEALEQAAPQEGGRVPSEIWLVDPAGTVAPALLWHAAGAQEGAGHAGA